VILIEQQFSGPNAGCSATDEQCGSVPVEWDDTVYEAIRTATAAGIIVVEPAANGSQNLDDPVYAKLMTRSDSGAIVVGAGADPTCTSNWGRPARSRLPFSNSGAFVDVQGWGECVTTTGYGYLQNATHADYTDRFGGTSSASPVVAGAAAIYSSVTFAATGVHPTSTQVRSAFIATGTPQNTSSANALAGRIGPLPNLAAALPVVASPTQSIVENVKLGTKVSTTISWSATSPAGISSYALWAKTNGGAWTSWLTGTNATSATYGLTTGTSYRFLVVATDAYGRSSSATGPTFTPTPYDDRSSGISYCAAAGCSSVGGWRSLAWDQAYASTVTKSTTSGDYAAFSFTGRDVALVASLGSNRGYARIFIDDAATAWRTVKLNQTTSAGATVVASKHFATSGTHTIWIQAIAQTGFPTAIDVDALIVNR